MIRYVRTASGKSLRGTVLLRLDFNAADNSRLEAALPTIHLLLRGAEKIVIMGHKGRPARAISRLGIPSGADTKKLSLRQNAKKLERLLGNPVIFVHRFDFENLRVRIARAPRGSIFFLENIRFLEGEDENDRGVARALASLADYYVNDAFATSHRNNASISAITKFLPSYAGIGFEREVKFLSRVLARPRHPLAIVVGGAKIADKLGILLHFRNNADYFLVGGGAANTLLAIKGIDIGSSFTEKRPSVLGKIRPFVKSKRCIIPVDWKSENRSIMDIGPMTTSSFENVLKNARMIIWNGPMGITEKKKFALGTFRIARAIARNKDAISIVGGGETVVFVKQHKLERKFSFVSTGGGAMLEFLSGKKLPGIEALERANSKAQRARTTNRK